jgi:signal transduction histidine kinase
MGYVLNTISFPRATVLISLAVVYLANGIYGYSWARDWATPQFSFFYFVVQLTLASTLLLLTKSPAIMLAMLPLAGQSVVILPRAQMYAFCAALWLGVVVPLVFSAGPGAALVLGMFFLAGIVFVVVITQLAVREQRARAEVERLLAELIDANAKLQQYAVKVEELATVSERNRLAREIHDSLGHYLTIVIVQIEAATAVMQTDRERSLDSLRKAQVLAQKGLAEVRRSVSALRVSGEDRPLNESLNTLFDECRASGVAVSFELLGTPRKLSPSVELAIYRGAQEALTNVRKHSRSGAAEVTLDYSSDTVWLVVHDEGVGAAAPEKGFGLVGLNERVQLLGGELDVITAPDQGFTLRIGLPG